MYIIRKQNLLVFLCFFSIHSLTQTIQYSGLSYISQSAGVEDLFPNTLKLESSLRNLLITHLKENKLESSNLKLGVSDSYKDGTLSLIISMESERVSSIFFNSKCLHTFSIGTQTIIFSSKDQQILSITPHVARKIYSDDLKGADCSVRKGKEDLLRFAEIFYGLDIPKTEYKEYEDLSEPELIDTIKKKSVQSKLYNANDSLLKPLFKDILALNLNSVKETNFYVGIDNVSLSELSSEQMLGQGDFGENHEFSDLFGFQESLYKVWVGQQFSKWFSDTFNYPLIPYVKGKSLGRDIAIKFADTGELLNLRLPSLDFGFVINVKGFKKVKLDESTLRQAYAWAAFGSIEFWNVDIEEITSINLKNVFTEEVNKSDEVDDWANFNLSFNRVLKDYVENLRSLDKKWLSKASRIKSKDFKKHSNIIKKNIGIKNEK